MKILVSILFIGLLVALGILCAVCVCARRRYVPGKADCIIVLGAKVWPDGRMSNSLIYRCEVALEAWEGGVAPEIILCGGRGHDEPVTEAGAMHAWLSGKGVPDGIIHIEDASRDTRENLNNAKAIMAENGFESACICTSDYHVARALWLAKDVQIHASAIAARSPSTLRSFIWGRCREAVSWVLYFFRFI